MKMRKNGLICLPLSLLLMSGTPSTTTVFSYIARKDVICKQLLCDYSSETISTQSNIKKDIVATLNFRYEVYQMYKPTELLTTYHPSYVFLYQADIYINNKVNYKGGMFNWFDGCHAGFLNYINFNAEFKGTSNVTKSYLTPSQEVGSEDGIRLLTGVYPTDPLYREPSLSTNKQTDYNRVNGTLSNYSIELFTDCDALYSNSYVISVYDGVEHPDQFSNTFDSRIAAKVISSKEINNNSVVFKQTFNYNNRIVYTDEKGSTAPHCSITHDDKGLYSGPCDDGKDLDEPFNFTFYGTFGVESETKPTTISFHMDMDTYHGSHVLNDTFESSASKSFDIQI